MRFMTLSILLLMLLLSAGCGKRPSASSTYEEGESPLGDPEESYGTNVQLSSGGEADLRKAKTRVRDQRYAEATRLLKPLTKHSDRDIREEAMLRLGEVQGALLNPDRDYAQAIATLRKLLHDSPDTDFRAEAEAAIERFEGFAARGNTP